ILVLSQSGAIIARCPAAALIISSAMQPDHHRALPSVAQPSGPHVQVKTVLARTCRSRRPQDAEEFELLGAALPARLRGGVTPIERVPNTGPGCGRLRRHEPLIASGRRSVWNALENVDDPLFAATDLACLRRYCRRYRTVRWSAERGPERRRQNVTGSGQAA